MHKPYDPNIKKLRKKLYTVFSKSKRKNGEGLVLLQDKARQYVQNYCVKHPQEFVTHALEIARKIVFRAHTISIRKIQSH